MWRCTVVTVECIISRLREKYSGEVEALHGKAEELRDRVKQLATQLEEKQVQYI